MSKIEKKREEEGEKEKKKREKRKERNQTPSFHFYKCSELASPSRKSRESRLVSPGLTGEENEWHKVALGDFRFWNHIVTMVAQTYKVCHSH